MPPRRTRARWSRLQQQLAERKAAAKEATCARCGQPIDKKAAKTQIDELTAQLAVAAAVRRRPRQRRRSAPLPARVAARKQHDELIVSTKAGEQQLHRLDGQRVAAVAERERAATALADARSEAQRPHEGCRSGAEGT